MLIELHRIRTHSALARLVTVTNVKDQGHLNEQDVQLALLFVPSHSRPQRPLVSPLEGSITEVQ